MLYPGLNERDPPKARAYAAQVLAKAFNRLRESGGNPPYDVLGPILLDAGHPLSDLQDRWWAGRATGELFKMCFALFNSDPRLVSWKHAIQLVKLTTKEFGVKGARTELLKARDQFLSVAHLWAARAIRGATPILHPEVGYDAAVDFQAFLAESEDLRGWGQTWRPERATSEPLLPEHVWRVPDSWEPPEWQPGWPKAGIVPAITVPEELLAQANIKPAGRPRKKPG
jgi:hypothetical protein